VEAVTSVPETTAREVETHGNSFAGELRLLTRGSSFGFIGQAANAVLAFAFSLAVGRLFHAQGTGTFFEALAIFTIASNVGDLGADDGLNWSLPRMRASGRFTDIRRLLPIACIPVLVLSSLLAIGLFVYAVPLGHLFNHGHNSTHLSSFIRILSPFVPVAALVEVLIAGTRGFDRVWPLASIWSVIMPIGRLVLLPLFLAAGMGLLAVAYAWSIPIVLGAAAMLWTLWTFVVKEHRAVVADATATPARQLALTFWSFSAPRALASICAMALVWLDVLLVGYLISVRMAGIYGVANRYLVVVTLALAAAGGTIAPQVSRLLAQGKVADVRRLYQTATGWVMAIGWPLSLTLAVFAPLFMRLFGAEFRVGATALAILALMMLYVSATGNNMVVLVMSGRTSTSLYVGVVTLALNVGANLYLIPRLGINGAALAWALSLFVSNAIITVILYRRLQLHPIGPAFLPVAAASVLLIGLPGLVFRLVLGPHWSALVLTAAIGGCSYLSCLWRFRDRLELSTFFSSVRS
jgi:O-antigen/teichoic acid export membrane protein